MFVKSSSLQQAESIPEQASGKNLQSSNTSNPESQAPMPSISKQQASQPQEEMSTKTWIILGSIGGVILLIALALGLFWDKIF